MQRRADETTRRAEDSSILAEMALAHSETNVQLTSYTEPGEWRGGMSKLSGEAAGASAAPSRGGPGRREGPEGLPRRSLALVLLHGLLRHGPRAVGRPENTSAD